MILAAVLGAVFFAAAGYAGAAIGLALAERLEILPDAPPVVSVPVAVLVAACALIGAAVCARTPDPAQVAIVALVCLALVGIWVVDARRGIVPDVFSLGALGVVLLVAIWQHEWSVLVSTGVSFAPFALAAAISKGHGMGWGDVKLAALGGAVLGLQGALLAFALACLAAVAINYFSGRRRGSVIAFAPYLAGAIGLAIPLGALH